MKINPKHIEMLLPWKLEHAIFIDRPNRFLTRININNKIVESHLPDPGRLRELLTPGVGLLVSKSSSPKRRTAYTTQAVFHKNIFVSINSLLPNLFTEYLLKNKCLSFLSDWQLLSPEIKFEQSRFNFLLIKGKNKMILEVKSVTQETMGRAMFLDVVTKRGIKHLIKLNKKGYQTAVLFVVQRNDVISFSPNWEIYPLFSKTLQNAHKNNVMIKVIKFEFAAKKLIYKGELPVNLDR